jgi:hypothetical protein
VKRVSEPKKRSISGYRKKKDLCVLCGTAEAESEHTCYENYVKSDMRGVELEDKDIISGKPELKPEESTPLKVIPELDARIKTILSYRRKKSLCVECGKVDEEADHDCITDFTASDMRTEKEKKKDPRIVETPKGKPETIHGNNKQDGVIEEFNSLKKDDFFLMPPTARIQSHRPFIILHLEKSDEDQMIEFSYLEFLARKHKSLIVYILGDLSEHYTYHQMSEIKELLNVMPVSNVTDQNIVNILHSCERFFGFPSRYITYCLCHKLECTVFFDNSVDEFDLACNIVSIPDNENVTSEIVKLHTQSWSL